ncbi:hypothetical protein PR001_g11046 [Phytophthora rubi]|uniref:Uncharacterized protein n=1 Tax=Phytophthora rubi TaxID=129364 RepID=A0A6A3MIH9_9STRA|nr:hypothetical protein PR002_g10872 [Phytophthora rubi]KAE9031322.1 hypothetical protein PR001_g11046 [Phytophthora rubi]
MRLGSGAALTVRSLAATYSSDCMLLGPLILEVVGALGGKRGSSATSRGCDGPSPACASTAPHYMPQAGEGGGCTPVVLLSRTLSAPPRCTSTAPPSTPPC